MRVPMIIPFLFYQKILRDKFGSQDFIERTKQDQTGHPET